jgi:hypothetical protein
MRVGTNRGKVRFATGATILILSILGLWSAADPRNRPSPERAAPSAERAPVKRSAATLVETGAVPFRPVVAAPFAEQATGKAAAQGEETDSLPPHKKAAYLRAIADDLEIPIGPLESKLDTPRRFNAFRARVREAYLEVATASGNLRTVSELLADERVRCGRFETTDAAGPPACSSPWTETVVVRSFKNADGATKRRIIRLTMGEDARFDEARLGLTDKIQILRMQVDDALAAVAAM